MRIAKVLIPLSTESKNPNIDIPPTEFVRGTYLEALTREDLFPSFVTVHMSEKMISQAVVEARGLLLCGGTDITPTLYGQEPHPLTKADSPLRDRLEIDLVRRFEELKMPTLGICRGCQVIPVALGGTLNQHVPEIVTEEKHGLCETQGYLDLLSSPKHRVQIEPDSLIARIIEQDNVDINSAHHQSVAHTGDKLRVSGRTGEGIAEFIEHVDQDQWMIGVQGHIEVEYGNPRLRRIFKAFADKIRGK